MQEEKRYFKQRDVCEMFDPLDKNNSDEDSDYDDLNIAYKVDAELIFEAWVRYRPKTGKNRQNKSQYMVNSPHRGSRSPISDISYAPENDIVDFGRALSNQDYHKKFNEQYPLDEIEQSILEEEKKIVKEFLSKFIASPEISMNNLIDVSRVLKALPKTFTYDNVVKSDIINMRNIQLSLISYQNESQDKLFQFYDTRIKTRVSILAKRAEENKDLIQDIKKYSNSLLSRLSRIRDARTSAKKKIPFNLDSE